ncbi:MAG: hypothetical protein K0U84_20220 [Actinomycetia bacterium]|nr:hypothetical protein [Actinomycetes bacterium]
MEIPLHPAVSAEIRRGRDLLDRVRALKHELANLTVTVPCPDGDNTIVLNGEGMIVEATFAEDLFERYPGQALGELLLVMWEEGFAQICAKVTDVVAASTESTP